MLAGLVVLPARAPRRRGCSRRPDLCGDRAAPKGLYRACRGGPHSYGFRRGRYDGSEAGKYNSLVAETDAAYDRLDDVGCDLINTKPTTFAGILALCRYVQPFFGESDPDELPNYILFDDDSTEYPAEALFRVIGSAIEALIKTPAGKAVRA